MKNSWNIFSNDAKHISKNWVAAILIGGLILLPSLYAWFNIEASWDPYGQTDQIPIGVVNEDAGATVRDQQINVGAELVSELKKNDTMEWHFTNKKDAMDNVENGDYFAVIVVPDDFSKKLASVVSDHPEKGSVEYYVNEKVNAIAPKITDKGASVIVNQISSNFVSTVNGVIFDMFNDLGLELEKDLPDIKKFEDYVFKMEEKLPDIHDLIKESQGDAKQAQSIIDKAQGMLPKAKQTTDSGLQTINETQSFLTKAENRLNEMAPKIKKDLKKAKTTAQDINDFMKEVQNTNIDFSSAEQIKKRLDTQVSESIERIGTVESALKQLQEMNQNQDQDQNQGQNQEQNENQNPPPPDGEGGQSGNAGSSQDQQKKIDKAIKNLELLRKTLQEAQDNVGKIDAFIKDKKQEVDNVLTNLEELSGKTSNRIGEFLKEYNENIEPAVRGEIVNAKKTLTDAKSILAGVKSTIPQVEKILGRTEGNIGEGQEMLQYILGQYPYVSDKVNQLADRIREIQGETDIGEIIELLQNNPDAEESFFAEPVKLHKNELFPIPNYGSGMTPFYTVLAIWVGALLLISLLATEAHHSENLTTREMYFGKLFTFLSIGFLQTLIVTLGDIFIVEVYVVHPVWFVLFGLLASLVFMLIVYTLVSVFGDVGKAMVIVLLVLQIAGAGGTYPVVLLPEFFQAINPFLPFTYAIDLMREAVGGIVWSNVYRDLIFLSLFGLVFMLFGAFFKSTINKQTHKLMKKSKESGLFH